MQTQMRNLINESFSKNELMLLCFDLGLDYDNLEGETKVLKIQNLIGYFSRRDELHHLVSAVNKKRPSLSLPYSQPQVITKELLVFETSTQRTILRIIPSGVEIHLEDSQPGKNDRRRTLSTEEVTRILQEKNISIRPNYTKNSGLFDLGPRKNWLYSKRIYSTPEMLKEALLNFLKQLTDSYDSHEDNVTNVLLLDWDWNNLKGKQYEEFLNALLSAFPSRNDLRRMLRIEMDYHLSEIESEGKYIDLLDELLIQMKAFGRRQELFESAIRSRPQNPLLLELKRKSRS